jgi:autotransporter translocation and assembly factor TamB
MAPDGVPAPRRHPARRRARLFRLVRWTLRGLAALALLFLLATGAMLFLTRTQAGQTFVLNRTVAFLEEGVLDGELRIGEIRSAGLLGGFLLRDVELNGPGGRPFLEADSIGVRYALAPFLARQVVVDRLELWRPRVSLEPVPGDPERLNVLHIFRVGTDGPEAEPDTAAPPPSAPPPVRLRDVRITDGTVTVRLPADPADSASRIPREELPGVGQVIRIQVSELEGLLPDLRILDPREPGQRIEIEHLAGLVRVFEEPFRVEDVRGLLSIDSEQLRLEADRFWLPGTEVAGTFTLGLGSEALELEADLEADVLQLADFLWIVPDLPSGSGGAKVVVRLTEGRTEVTARDVDLQSGRSRIRGGGEMVIPADGGPIRLAGVDVEALPLGMEVVAPWLPESFPLAGTVRGRVRADGPLDGVRVAGQLTLVEAGRTPTTALVTGTVHLADNPGGTGLAVALDPLDYALVGDLLPGFRLTGGGRAEVRVNGRYGGPVEVAVSARHEPAGLPVSLVEVRGRVSGRGEAMVLELDGALRPLSLTSLARAWPAIPVEGVFSGDVSARGPLRDLLLGAVLETEGGLVEATGRLDALDPAAGYAVEAEVAGFELARLLAGVPDSTILTGRMELEGRGLDPAEAEASARITLGASRVAGLPVEGASAAVRVGEGHLTVAALELRSPAVRLSGAGALALEPTEGEILLPGETAGDPHWISAASPGLPTLPPIALPGAADPTPALRIEIQESDLEALRPFLMPGWTVARDGLSPLDMEILRLDGIDPDTLPTLAQMALSGDIRGEVVLRGSVTRFRADGDVGVEGIRYGSYSLSGGRVAFSFRDPLHGLSPMAVRLDVAEVEALGRRFDTVEGFLGLVDGAGEAAVRLARASEEDEIVARSTFTLAEEGTLDAELLELTLAGRDGQWALQRPARIVRDSTSIRFADFRLWRPEPGGVRIEADGVIPSEGAADFTLSVRDLDLERLVALLQLDLDLAGRVELDTRITGTARAPVIQAAVATRGLRWQAVPLEEMDGTLAYADRRVDLQVQAREEGETVLEATMRIPADLSFREVPRRFPDDPLEGEVVLREFPAGVALGILDVLGNVQGTLSGEVRLSGTVRDLSPSGRVVLAGGAATLEELGVRYTGVNLEAGLEPDGVIRLDGVVRAGGEARVAGTVDISDLIDPAFDLNITASGFQAANRRDIQGRVGGNVTLSGSYREPFVGGSVRVEQGNLFLDEFVRAATVVDLTDPAFFNVIDTTTVSTLRPILESTQNPFIQNLRMSVGLDIERDVWLRSSQINVEIAGELTTVFDRRANEIILVGQLEAVRGSYNGFGRRFEVQEGVVEFAGTPGIDPRLDIQATTRLRTQDELLNIVANLEGTLLQPRVSLTSDSEPPLAASELASYLIFGRPSPFLSEGEQSIVSSATGAVSSLGLGVVANQLGSAVAQQVGLDYFAITTATQADLLGGGSGAFRGSVAATQFELGQYLADDIFVALLLRPLSSFGEGGQSQFSGARVEWRFADLWTVEGFVEDRFSREGLSGFRELGFTTAKTMGLLLYREWGY